MTIKNKLMTISGGALLATTLFGGVVEAAPTEATNVSQQTGYWQGKNFIKADGTQAKGEWIQDNGSWFYIKDNGEYASDEWIGNYYFKYWGYMAQNEWLESNGKWYFLKADGQYAWQEWMGNYYFNYWGDMAVNQWIDSNGKWYYAKADGTYAWEEWIGNYYFNYWGDMAKEQWVEYNNNWYYLKADGQYASEEWVGSYYFNYWGDMARNTTIGYHKVGPDGKLIVDYDPNYDSAFNQNINIPKVNQCYYELVKQHRESLGLVKLETQTDLQKYSELRAHELAAVFSPRRPNGDDFKTVLTEYSWYKYSQLFSQFVLFGPAEDFYSEEATAKILFNMVIENDPMAIEFSVLNNFGIGVFEYKGTVYVSLINAGTIDQSVVTE